MSCSEIQELLIEYVLDELDEVQESQVDQHLAAGCQACQAELQVISESMDQLWRVTPNGNISVDLRREIVARCVADTLPQGGLPSPQAVRRSEPHRSRLSSSLIQALIAFAAGLVFMMTAQPWVKKAMPIRESQLERLRPEVAVSLATPPIPSSLELSEKKHESTHLVGLRRQTGSNELRGHVLWDSLTRELHLFCFGLRQPPPGTQYALWLIGPGIEVRAAEKLEVDSGGMCKATVPWPAGEFQFAKVTLESSANARGGPSEQVELTTNAIQPFSY